MRRVKCMVCKASNYYLWRAHPMIGVATMVRLGPYSFSSALVVRIVIDAPMCTFLVVQQRGRDARSQTDRR
jgi:hypothetical protein